MAKPSARTPFEVSSSDIATECCEPIVIELRAQSKSEKMLGKRVKKRIADRVAVPAAAAHPRMESSGGRKRRPARAAIAIARRIAAEVGRIAVRSAARRTHAQRASARRRGVAVAPRPSNTKLTSNQATTRGSPSVARPAQTRNSTTVVARIAAAERCRSRATNEAQRRRCSTVCAVAAAGKFGRSGRSRYPRGPKGKIGGDVFASSLERLCASSLIAQRQPESGSSARVENALGRERIATAAKRPQASQLPRRRAGRISVVRSPPGTDGLSHRVRPSDRGVRVTFRRL